MPANTLGVHAHLAASAMPSTVAIISMASIMLLQIRDLTVARAAACTMFLPIACRMGLARSKSAASPPTMKVKGAGLRATGAARHRGIDHGQRRHASIATSRAVCGSMVENR